jgi:hypothetical protein
MNTVLIPRHTPPNGAAPSSFGIVKPEVHFGRHPLVRNAKLLCREEQRHRDFATLAGRTPLLIATCKWLQPATYGGHGHEG